MNIKRICEKFQAIGASFTITEIPEPRYRSDAPLYTVNALSTRRGPSVFELGIIAKARQHLDVNVPSIDRRRRLLLMSIRFYDEYQQFLCGNDHDGCFVREVPAGTSGGIRQAVDALKKADEKAHEEKKRAAARVPKGKKKRGAQAVPSFEQVQNSVKMSRESYEFYCHLLGVCRRLKLAKSNQQVIPQYGGIEKNTFPFALMRVGAVSARRVRDLDGWKPKSHNPHKQFGSLVRHLFANYPVPEFMDSVWFRNDDLWTRWFLDLGTGKNVRNVDAFPLQFTKKMAHAMLQAPAKLTVEEAIRWGQVTALGGNDRFFHEIQRTRIAPVVSTGEVGATHHSFWQTVIEWFLRNPMLDTAHYGPIVDFIEHQKFAPPRANPAFEITGRSPQAVLRLLDEWHGALGKARRRQRVSWAYHGLDWRWKQKRIEKVLHTWEVREILDSNELLEEGRRMHHCVYTYTDSCVKGRSAIFSLRCDGDRVLTVEYLPQFQRLGEIRGVSNRRPASHEMSVLKRWAQEKGLQKAWLLMT